MEYLRLNIESIRYRALLYGRQGAPNLQWDVPGREQLVKRFNDAAENLFTYGELPERRKLRMRHPFYLGMGSSATAFKFDGNNGETYVARAMGGQSALPHEVPLDSYVLPMLIARGQPGFEQIVACSYDKNICISHFIDAPLVCNLPPDYLNAVTYEHIVGAFQTIDFATKHNIVLDDFVDDHWFFDPDVGFTVIDPLHTIDASLQYNDPMRFACQLLPDEQLDMCTLEHLAALHRVAALLRGAAAMYYPSGDHKTKLDQLAVHVMSSTEKLQHRLHGRQALRTT